jgi:hypothetical protein
MKKYKPHDSALVLLAGMLLFVLQGCGEKKKEAVEEETGDSTVEMDDEGFRPIFDGKTLEGWEGDPTYWSVEDGNLKGEVTPETLLDNNTFIIWKGGQPDDFERQRGEELLAE